MKNKFLLIGLTGHAGVGKDTIAESMAADPFMLRYGLAEPIKKGICEMFGLSMTVFENRVQKEVVIPWIGKSPRYLAQKLGTEFGRDMVQRDIWLRIMKQKYEVAKENFETYGMLRTVPKGFIVTDVRFDNEAEYIKNLGGVIWKVERKVDVPVLAHASEQGVSAELIDAVINNNGSLETTFAQVDELLNVLRSQA